MVDAPAAAVETPPKPQVKPADPRFSAGPCKKRPGWTPSALSTTALGRYHRSGAGRARLREAVAKTRAVLEIPDTHAIAITPASDTGAIEMALWGLLGPVGVDVYAWESFGREWVRDVVEELRLPETRVIEAPYGALPPLGPSAGAERDVVFTWNGTTSGVRVPDGDWIAQDRAGLTLCDATSAVFAQTLPWAKIDVATFSFQKALGGEGQHGVLVMNERARMRAAAHAPTWPIPKTLRFPRKDGGVDPGFFDGATVNTPSMLVIEDWIDALDWAQAQGGLAAMIARANANLAALERWVARTPWVRFLAEDPTMRSNTSVCLAFADPRLDEPAQRARAAAMVALLEKEGAAFDVAAYRKAPPGLRVWCGPTVEAADVAALTPWLDWAYAATAATPSQ